MGRVGYSGLVEAIARERDGLVAQIVELVRLSPVRIPGALDGGAVARYGGTLLDGVMSAVGGAEPDTEIRPGSREARELERQVAFVGANLATTAQYAYDIAAVVLAVRDAVLPHVSGAARTCLDELFSWLVLVGMESYSSAALARQTERTREQLERGMPVVLITPEVPAVFLIGDGRLLVLETVFGKLLLAVARVGAKAVIIDVTGLADAAADPVLSAVGQFLDHRKICRGVHTMAVGLSTEAEAAWAQLADAENLSFHRGFDVALARALDLSGRRIVRSPGSLE